MSEAAGKINEYVCEQCRGITRTINRDEGTTPFMLKCRVNNVGCGGFAQSSFYRNSQLERPAWEWIAPTPEEFEQWIKDHKAEEYRESHAEHVKNGGMLLRKLDAIRLHNHGYRTRRA